jgi:hypothetical protein
MDLLVILLLQLGCASNRVFDASAALPNASDRADGVLIVYSAPDPHAHFNGSPYNIHYSDYTVCSRNGTILETVSNDLRTMLEGPAKVHLPPGEYEVRGRSLSRFVTMQVEIIAHQVTTVHLN